MIARPKTALAGLKIRLREPLRARLKSTAKRRGVSLNKELVAQLEQSFAKDDAFSDPDIANMMQLLGAAFVRGGQRGAAARKHPEWKPAQWLNDTFCYEAAFHALRDALVMAAPEYEGKRPDIFSWAAQTAARGGDIKYTKGDDK